MGDCAIPIKMDTTPKFGERDDAAFTLRSRENGGGINDMVLTPWDNQGWRVHTVDGVSPTISAKESGSALTGSPCVLTPWDVQSKRVNAPHGISPTLQSGGGEGMTIQPIVLTTANTNANGSNVNQDGACYTLDGTNSNAVAFAQNTRDEVRLFGGDGQVVGALSAQPGMKQTSYVCVADDNAKAAVDEDLCGSLKVGGGVSHE